jgi:hypothetical protein
VDRDLDGVGKLEELGRGGDAGMNALAGCDASLAGWGRLACCQTRRWHCETFPEGRTHYCMSVRLSLWAGRLLRQRGHVEKGSRGRSTYKMAGFSAETTSAHVLVYVFLFLFFGL